MMVAKRVEHLAVSMVEWLVEQWVERWVEPLADQLVGLKVE